LWELCCRTYNLSRLWRMGKSPFSNKSLFHVKEFLVSGQKQQEDKTELFIHILIKLYFACRNAIKYQTLC